MSSSFLSRASAVLAIATLVLFGVILGTFVDVLREPGARASVASLPSAPQSPAPSQTAAIPVHDVAGEDFAALPRYPGSTRSAYEVIADESYELVAAEYLARATVEEVRAFYQGVIAEHGWDRADITYADGEWAYVLSRGADEALIEIELRGGVVEIDLQLSRPLDAQPPALGDALPPTQAPSVPDPAAPAPQVPPAPLPAPGGGEEDDAGEGGEGSGEEGGDD